MNTNTRETIRHTQASSEAVLSQPPLRCSIIAMAWPRALLALAAVAANATGNATLRVNTTTLGGAVDTLAYTWSGVAGPRYDDVVALHLVEPSVPLALNTSVKFAKTAGAAAGGGNFRVLNARSPVVLALWQGARAAQRRLHVRVAACMNDRTAAAAAAAAYAPLQEGCRSLA